jgi:hypothetical protein
VSPTTETRVYGRGMSAPALVILNRRKMIWIGVSGLVAITAATALGYGLRQWTTWPFLVTEWVGLAPTLGPWAAALYWILLRPLFRHKRATQRSSRRR